MPFGAEWPLRESAETGHPDGCPGIEGAPYKAHAHRSSDAGRPDDVAAVAAADRSADAGEPEFREIEIIYGERAVKLINRAARAPATVAARSISRRRTTVPPSITPAPESRPTWRIPNVPAGPADREPARQRKRPGRHRAAGAGRTTRTTSLACASWVFAGRGRRRRSAARGTTAVRDAIGDGDGAGPRIRGRRDVTSSSCPGALLCAWVRDGAPGASPQAETLKAVVDLGAAASQGIAAGRLARSPSS
jgi:hypothetical protein